MAESNTAYYVPHGSRWPLLGSIGLLTLVVSVGHVLNGETGWVTRLPWVGVAILVVMLFGWFGTVISESVSGRYNQQVDGSFRLGMMWFIFSEVMFFAAFFGALFYTRNFDVPWLAGAGHGAMTNFILWPDFHAAWPSNGPGNIGGDFTTIPAFDVPLLNTLLLLSSGVTITIAHWALIKGQRLKLIGFLAATVALGVTFLTFQAHEYIHAYTELNLTLGSGIYGSTFFMLTGFHGLHVTLGAIMLTVILLRAIRGHFDQHHHFGFEAVAWYWHFVDVVWLLLFVFVYVI